MPDLSTLSVYALASVVVLLIPGPAVLYIVTRSIDQGRTAGLVSALAAGTGNSVQVLFAAAGLSAILAASSIAFSVIKYAGAAYLIFLGVRRLLTKEEVIDPDTPRDSLSRIYWQGVIICILNPKVALFFLAFLPQFVDPERTIWTQVVILGLTFVGLGFLSDGLYALAAGTLGRWLRARWRMLRYASGSVFVGLGVSAALAKRT